MSSESVGAAGTTRARSREGSRLTRLASGRNRYLVAALCVFLCALMVAPLVLTVLASLKTTAEAAAQPPTYFPHELSLDSYARLCDYQAGLLKRYGYTAKNGCGQAALCPADRNTMTSLLVWIGATTAVPATSTS